MIAKLLPPDSVSAAALSQEIGVSQTSLSRWLREAKLRPVSSKKKSPVSKQRSRRRTPEEKYRLVKEAAGLQDVEVGEFLRREGLYEADLVRLREEVEAAALAGMRASRAKPGSSTEAKRIKQLERELRRKEKALAETAALLVLRKKLGAFFSEGEEGDTDEKPES